MCVWGGGGEKRKKTTAVHSDVFTVNNTVLSGPEERRGGGGGGVDGPSLDRSYFSRLQPIPFLFFNPSSSPIAKLVARTRYSMSMFTHTQRMPGRGSG